MNFGAGGDWSSLKFFALKFFEVVLIFVREWKSGRMEVEEWDVGVGRWRMEWKNEVGRMEWKNGVGISLGNYLEEIRKMN